MICHGLSQEPFSSVAMLATVFDQQLVSAYIIFSIYYPGATILPKFV